MPYARAVLRPEPRLTDVRQHALVVRLCTAAMIHRGSITKGIDFEGRYIQLEPRGLPHWGRLRGSLFQGFPPAAAYLALALQVNELFFRNYSLHNQPIRCSLIFPEV